LPRRKPLLNLDKAAFMRRHWQRRPLVVRGAFAPFEDPMTPAEVLALAGDEAARSRLVRRRGVARWTLEHGPFSRARLKQLPRRDWTVLVQDTNHFSARAERLLAEFDFIPHARVDDLMVSYAVPGGGVGPHVDSYDVFLLQGHGRRRWQVSRQADTAFVPGLDLRILARFEPEEEWVLGPGDMLYLPPNVSHHGIAETECLTWSVGFRAPSDAELIRGFLDFLHDGVSAPGQYADAGARPTRHPGAIPPRLLDHVARTVSSIRWNAAQARDFAGRILSEPRAHVFFDPPARPLAPARFAAAAARHGLALDLRSRLLFSGSMFYMTGEPARAGAAAARVLRRLADARRLSAPIVAPGEFWKLAHAWYLQGYLHPSTREEEAT
jgi:50S ribosomal protein L16 3-hydroxylase